LYHCDTNAKKCDDRVKGCEVPYFNWPCLFLSLKPDPNTSFSVETNWDRQGFKTIFLLKTEHGGSAFLVANLDLELCDMKTGSN
jgi:hypothetical protein